MIKANVLMQFLAALTILSCSDRKMTGNNGQLMSLTSDVTMEQNSSYDSLSVSFKMLPSPMVSLQDVQIFNSKLFVKMRCEKFDGAKGKCGEPVRQYKLTELRVGMIAVQSNSPLKDQLPMEKLAILDFDSINPDAIPSADGEIDFGPLTLPAMFEGQSLGLVLRDTINYQDKEYSSYKVFVLKKAL